MRGCHSIADYYHVMAKHRRLNGLKREFLSAVAHSTNGKNSSYLVPEKEAVTAKHNGAIQKSFALTGHRAKIHGRTNYDAFYFILAEFWNNARKIIVNTAFERFFTMPTGTTAMDIHSAQFYDFCFKTGLFFSGRLKTLLQSIKGGFPLARTAVYSQYFHFMCFLSMEIKSSSR
jgi:hypothetical protein